jgi:predicted Zn-dependent protease
MKNCMRRTVTQKRPEDNGISHRLPLRKGLMTALLTASVLISTSGAHAEPALPVLTDATSSIITLEDEHRLGRNWARILRGQAPLLSDPIVKQYLSDLLWQVVPNSALTDRRLELIVLDKASFNAFAVPGGIVGIHGGLITASESEAELASVIAHELAHLSQRHYAQQLEENRRNRPLMLAGVLASILVAAADGQAGTAALSSTLGGAAQAQLAFSRRNEQEADRIGMQTLSASGYDPYAMPRMFERLQKSYRFYGQKPPEFLLTHPVTESRIADSLNRASSLPRPAPLQQSLLYPLVRTRLLVHYAQDLPRLLEQFTAIADGNAAPQARYGEALAALALNRFDTAQAALDALPAQWRKHPYVRLTELDLLLARQQFDAGWALARELRALYPDSMPVRYRFALTARQVGEYRLAAETFQALTSEYPTDADFWFQLAETEGLNGRINAVHLARIEYFMLTGQLDLALRQVQFASREKELTEIDKARLTQKEQEIRALRQQMKEDLS